MRPRRALTTRTASATYRVQLHAGFGFDARGGDRPDYLAALGVSHLYSSPYLQAAPGSPHGYDVVDPDARQRRARRRRGHRRACVDGARASTTGPRRSTSCRTTWPSPGRQPRGGGTCSRTGPPAASPPSLRHRLGAAEERAPEHGALAGARRPVRRVLESGRAAARARAAARFVRALRGPPLPDRAALARHRLLDARGRAREQSDELALASLERVRAAAARHEPDAASGGASATATRRCCAPARRLLRGRVAARPRAPSTRRSPASTPTPTRSTRCSSARTTASRYWRVATEELDYRRFFDINDARRPPRRGRRACSTTPTRCCFGWSRAGVVDGLRVDHPDGLRDPRARYLERLRAAAPRRLARGGEDPRRRRGAARRLADRRARPATTSSTAVGGLFVDPRRRERR